MTTRKVKYTSKFKRDYKREKKSGHHRTTLDDDLISLELVCLGSHSKLGL